MGKKSTKQRTAKDSILVWNVLEAIRSLQDPHPWINTEAGPRKRYFHQEHHQEREEEIDWDERARILKLLDQTIEYVEAKQRRAAVKQGRDAVALSFSHMFRGLNRAAKLPDEVSLNYSEERVERMGYCAERGIIDYDHACREIHHEVHQRHWLALIAVFEFAWAWQDRFDALEHALPHTPDWFQANLDCKRLAVIFFHWEAAVRCLERAKAHLEKRAFGDCLDDYLCYRMLTQTIINCTWDIVDPRNHKAVH